MQFSITNTETQTEGHRISQVIYLCLLWSLKKENGQEIPQVLPQSGSSP